MTRIKAIAENVFSGLQRVLEPPLQLSIPRSRGSVIQARLDRRVSGNAVSRRDDRVLYGFATAFVALFPILWLTERSAVHAAPVARHFQVKRLADPIHHAKRLVSGQ